MRSLVSALAVVCAVLPARSAWAQSAPATRPYRGLFGGGAGSLDQSLTLTLSLIGGYDTSVQSAIPSLPDTGSSTGALGSQVQSFRTAFEQATAGLAYSLSRKRASLTASATTGGTYYQVLGKTIVSTAGSVGGSFAFSSRTSLSGTETLAYQPLFFSNAFPASGGIGIGVGQPIIPDTTTGARLNDYVSKNSLLSLSHKLSRRVDVSLGYARDDSTFASDEGFLNQTITGRLTFRLTQHLSIWASDGYFDSEARSADVVSTTRGQLVNFGLGYDRLASLSLTRHLTLGLGVGASVVSDGNQRQLAATGNATLTDEIGRSWTASLGYRRQVGFVEFFQQPVTSDEAFAGLGGLIARRVKFQASAGVSHSTVGFHGPANGFQTDYATVSLSCGLTQSLAVGIGYSDYRYNFGGGLQLPTGVLSHTDGQSVYAFLNVWEPLFTRTRRGDASR
jgi:hypothetical protein